MKSAVILSAIIACAYAMVAPATTNVGATTKRLLTKTTITNPAPTGDGSSAAQRSSDTSNVGLENQNSNTFGSRSFSFIDDSGKLRKLDDDDFITSGSSGRQVTFQTKQTSIPSQATSNNLGSVTASGQRKVDLITFSDSSDEIDDDLDDFDDFGIFPSVNGVPFVARRNAISNIRVVSPSSIFSPVIRAPVRHTNTPKFVQIDQNSLRTPVTTCTCPPQRNIITRFQPTVTPTSQFWQLMRFPQQQQSFNQFIQPTSDFATQFPGVQFVFDD